MAWQEGINAEIAENVEVMSSPLTPFRMKGGREVTNGLGRKIGAIVTERRKVNVK